MFQHDLLCSNKLCVLMIKWLSLENQLSFYSLSSKLRCFSPGKLFLKVNPYSVALSAQILPGVFFREILFRNFAKCFWYN